MQYAERNRRMLQRRYRSFEDFNREFEVGQDLLKTFRSKADDAGIKFDQEQYDKSLPIFKTQLKATVARMIWGMNAYYQVILDLDETVQRAVEYMKTGQ
jgi:carboxyl-terminal processing protease